MSRRKGNPGSGGCEFRTNRLPQPTHPVGGSFTVGRPVGGVGEDLPVHTGLADEPLSSTRLGALVRAVDGIEGRLEVGG